MDEYKSWSSDEELFTEFKIEDIFSYIEKLRHQAENFLRNTKMPPSVYLNYTVYFYCCRDIIIDLERFESNKILTSDDKSTLNAYTAAWWIKRKPFQFKEMCPQEILYVNETFAATLLFQASNLYDKNFGRYTVGTDKLVEIAAPLMHYLKYQSVTPQTLELFLKGLNFFKED